MSERFFEENTLDNTLLELSGEEYSYEYEENVEYSAVSGKVIIDGTGEPVPNAPINVEIGGNNLEANITTNSNGFFEIPFDLVKMWPDGSLSVDEVTIRDAGYAGTGRFTFSANARSNIILKVKLLEEDDSRQELETLNIKSQFTIHLITSNLPSLPQITVNNCKDYFNLSFIKQSDPSIIDISVCNTEMPNAFEYCANIGSLSISSGANYIDFIFTALNVGGKVQGTPHCYSIGTLTFTGSAGYGSDKFQVSNIITGNAETYSQTVTSQLFSVIQSVAPFTIKVNFVDSDNVRLPNPEISNLYISCSSTRIYSIDNTQTVNGGTLAITISDSSILNNVKEFDLITVESTNYYSDSFILTRNPQPNNGYTVDLIFGNKNSGTVISSDETWHEWTKYAMPWYKKTMNIKYSVKDINSGNTKDFTESNISIFNVRNTTRPIDEQGAERKRMPKFENNEIIPNTEVNPIYVVRNKTINGNYYTFNLPYYQECYPSYMITKQDTYDNVELHRYVNTYLSIKYRSNNGTEDYYVENIAFNNSNVPLNITYLSNSNQRESIDVGDFASNDKTIKIQTDSVDSNKIIKLALRGNSSIATGNTFNSIYLSPVYPSNLINSDTLDGNIVLLSAIYKSIKCHNEVFDVNISPQSNLEYTYNYSYSELNIGNYNYTFTQDTITSTGEIGSVKRNMLAPDVKLTNIGGVDVVEADYDINGSLITTSKAIIGTDSNKNKFISSGNLNVTFTYDTNSEKTLSVTYNVVSNPILTVDGLSFNVNDNTYTVSYSSNLTMHTDYFNKANLFDSINLKENNNYSLYLITSQSNDTVLVDNVTTIEKMSNIEPPIVNHIINDSGIITYNRYSLSVLPNYETTYSFDLSSWHSFVPNGNNITFDGGTENSNIICYASIFGGQLSTYNATYIANVVENDMLGYIYKTTLNDNVIYSSNEIEQNINKYYLYNESQLSKIEYVNAFEHNTSSSTRIFTYEMDMTTNNKFVHITTVNSPNAGIYAALIGDDLQIDGNGIYITKDNVNMYIKKGNDDICKTESTLLTNLLNNKCNHSFITAKIYSGESLLDKFQEKFYCYFGNNGNKHYFTTYNDFASSTFITDYGNYLIANNYNNASLDGFSYDYNTDAMPLEILGNYVDKYYSIYTSAVLGNNVFSINNISNTFGTQYSGFYEAFIKPYESIRDTSGGGDSAAFHYSYHYLNNATFYGGSETYFNSLRDYFAHYSEDSIYQTSSSYIESMYYAYGIAYNYVYKLITESASYYEITNDAYKLKLKDVDYNNTNIMLADGNEMTRPNPMPDKFNVIYSSGVTWGNHIISEKLSFITDYNTSMCNYYNLFFTKDPNGSLTVSDINTKFNSLHLLSDIPGWTNSNIYTKYNTLANELTSKSLYIKFSNNDYNYSTIKTNINNYKITVDLFNSICTNISTLLKTSNGAAASTAVTIIYSESNWQNLISLFKSLKTSVSSATTEGDYYVFNKPADFSNALLSGEYDKIYILKSIYDTYKGSPIVTIVDNLAGIHYNSSDDTLCEGIYNAMYTGTSYYQNNKFVVNELLKNINTEASKICNRFDEFINYSLTSIFTTLKNNIDTLLDTTHSNAVYLDVNSFDILYDFTLFGLADLLSNLTTNGPKILIRRYLTRAYNYSKIIITQNSTQTNATNTITNGITTEILNNEINEIKKYLQDILFDINRHDGIDIYTSLSGNAIAKFEPINVHKITIKCKQYNGYNIYYSNDLDFIDNTDRHLVIKYGLFSSPQTDITEKIHTSNISNSLQMFNGTIKVDTNNKYLYMFVFFNDTMYKQIHFNVSAGDDSYLLLNTPVYSIENNIIHTLEYNTGTLSISFDISNLNETYVTSGYYTLEFEYKTYNSNWNKNTQTIINGNNVINKQLMYNPLDIKDNVYIFRYRIKYNNIYTPYRYFTFVSKLENTSTYMQRIINSTNVSSIGNTGHLYLTKEGSDNKKWYWVANVLNATNGGLQFKLINTVYKINSDGSPGTEDVAEKCSPALGSHYYENWNYLIYCLNHEAGNINNYKHELRWQ